MRGIEWLNALSTEEAAAELHKCCGSTIWARRMAQQHRPFRDAGELDETADQVWRSLAPADWLEAFSGHPKIGGQKAAQAEEAQRWSEDEQSGTRGAAHETLSALAEANGVYENKFGFIFIICATGKTSAEILASLRERLPNEPKTELRVAAEQQRLITRLRLQKLLNS